MVTDNRMNLEEILLKAGLVNTDKLEELREIHDRTGERMESLLLSGEAINYKEILGAMAKKMNVEFIDLEEISVNKRAILVLSSEVALKYHVLPFDIRDNHLFLAMKEPDDIFLIDEIKVFAQMEIKPFLADSRLIGKALGLYYSNDLEEMKSGNPGQKDFTFTEKGTAGGRLVQGAHEAVTTALKDADVNSMIRQIIISSLKVEDVTDIHIDTVNRNIIVTLSVHY